MGRKKEGKDQHFLLLIPFSTGHTPASEFCLLKISLVQNILLDVC